MGKLSNCTKFAVVDTETNYQDSVISIGAVIVDAPNFDVIDKLYLIVYPACTYPAMFSEALEYPKVNVNLKASRKECTEYLKNFLDKYEIKDVFAYNASFDRNHLRELYMYNWYDIMKIAAYIQYNPALKGWGSFCSTGRLKTGYGAENILNILYEENNKGEYGQYTEIHNALTDSIDEVEIMKLLGLCLETYEKTIISEARKPFVRRILTEEEKREKIIAAKKRKIERQEKEKRQIKFELFPILYRDYDLKEAEATKDDKKLYFDFNNATIQFKKTMTISGNNFYCGFINYNGDIIPVYTIISKIKNKIIIKVYKNYYYGDLVIGDTVIENIILNINCII